jgi:hypothetical protein
VLRVPQRIFLIKQRKLKSIIYDVPHYVIYLSLFYFMCLEFRLCEKFLSNTLNSCSRHTNTGLSTLCCPSKGLKNDKMKTQRQLAKESRQTSKQRPLNELWGLTVVGIMGFNEQIASEDVSLRHSACCLSDYTAHV